MPFITPEQLKESKKKDKITVVFGRFQPPTLGHKALFDLAVQNGKENETDVIIVPTSTCEKKDPLKLSRSPTFERSKEVCSKVRYPLTYDQKKNLLTELYPQGVFSNHRFLDISKKTEYNQLIELLKFLNLECGYKELYFIAGDERVDQFQNLIIHQNKSSYHFDKIHDVIDVAQGQSRIEINVYKQDVPMSGTLVRIAALLGLKDAFYESIKTYNGFTMEQSNHWMNELRKGMGLMIQVKEQDEETVFLQLLHYLGIKTKEETEEQPTIKKRRTTQRGGFYIGYLLQLLR